MSNCGLEVDTIEKAYPDEKCDGCGKNYVDGERVITKIDSCCGGGCYRSLCFDCVKAAYAMIHEVK